MKKLLCFLLLPIIFVGMNICYIKDIYTLAGYALFIGINFLFSCLLCLIVSQISKNANGLLFNTMGMDSVFGGDTLDCFYFNKLTCYDLKDFYVDAAIGI